jgi:mannose-1-phosphate guanylyltransferase
MRLAILLLLTVVPGIAGVVGFGYGALQDWDQLQIDYKAYQQVAQSSVDLAVLMKAEAAQNIHRINLFADGVWVLLSAILGAIGLHGFYVGSKR